MTSSLVAMEGRLSADQIRFYEDEGYLVVREVFSPVEMALVSMEADRLLERADLIDTANIRCRWQTHCDTGACLFDTFDPFIDLAPLCAKLARDPRLLGLVSSLYGEEAFLFKDKLIFKRPGAGGHDLHQDYIAWPTFPKSFLTALVAIDAATVDNGCTEAFPGYHKDGYLSPADGMYHPLATEAVEEARCVPLELRPGDVAVFGCLTPHRSAPNRSAGWRRQLYLSYNAASDGGDSRAAHYEEFHVWLKERYAEYGKHDVWFR